MEALASAIFWLALLTIIWGNILRSGGNAVVIALASRNLPAQQQRKAIIFGSKIVRALMQRFPVIVTLAALLGFVASERAMSDNAVVGWIGQANSEALDYTMSIAGAIIVVLGGKFLGERNKRKAAVEGA